MSEDQNGTGEANARVELPPLRTFKLFEYDPVNGEVEVLVEGHTLQTTEAGGLNVLEFVSLPNGQPAQKMRMGFAPNHWRKVVEVMIEPVTPSRIIH